MGKLYRRFITVLAFALLLLPVAPSPVQAKGLPPLTYTIPPKIYDWAKKALKTDAGNKYDQKFGEALGPRFRDYLKECATDPNAVGWHRIAICIAKDGTPKYILADGHDLVNDCLAPKFQKEKFPPPPMDGFYYLFELKVDK